MTGRIDDGRTIGIQFPQSIDQGKGFRCTVHAGFTHRMVPHQSWNVGIQEKRSDRSRTGIERELGSSSEIKHAFLRIGWWIVGVNEGPAAIKDRLPQFLRDIDGREICGAKCRHEQDKLEVGHSWVLDIKGRHDHPLSEGMPRESTIV